jgi:competence ComEA-like helix-hairpin-helix protein
MVMARLRLQVVFVLLGFAAAAAGQDGSAQLPEGNGKVQVGKICSGCHELSTVTGSRRTRIGWQENVDDMVTRGAEGSDEDLRAVVDYLTRYFGKINVNTASAKDLESFLGVSENSAEAIVAYRRQNGDFKDFTQLTKVPGVSLTTLQAKKSQIAFRQ